MKKYFPVILFLATITLSACGSPKIESEKVESQKVESENIETKKSLKELLGLGTSQKCSYEIKTEDQNMKGEVIVSGKKFKQTTEISNEEGSMKVYGISDGTYFYSWNEAMKGNGIKMNIADLEKSNEDTKIETQKVNMDEKIDYKCSPATLSDSDLAIPSDIKFLDYTEMMKGLQDGNFEDFKNLIPSGEE